MGEKVISAKEFQPIALCADIPPQARYWRNHHQIWRWCRQNTLISEAHQNRWLKQIEQDPTIKMFGIYAYTKENPGYVGVCGFTSINGPNASAEFSLYIAPEHQGKGYGRKALALLVGHGFVDFGFKRIWGEVFEGNPAMKMFHKVGFKVDGTLRSSYWKEGAWIDSHMVSILDDDWIDLQSKKPRLVGDKFPPNSP